MKSMKKLIPALCLLLVSAVLMGTSTYAWFTMNKTVTATGMQVKARAEGGIVIGREGIAREDASITLEHPSTEAQELLPTSTANASIWFHAEANAYNAFTAKTGTLKTLTLSNTEPTEDALGIKYDSANDESVYVLYDTVTVYPDKNSASFTDLWVSACSVSGNSKDLSKSIRVAFVADSNVVICAPATGASTTYTVGTNADGATKAGTTVKPLTTVSADKQTTGDGTKNILKSGDVDDEGIDVNVYVYFEGEDASHTTEHLDDSGIEDLTISYAFSCTSVAAATAD